MNSLLVVKENEWELLFNQIQQMDISFILKELIKLLKIKYLKFKEDFLWMKQKCLVEKVYVLL